MKTVNNNNSLSEALTAIIKPIVMEVIREAMTANLIDVSHVSIQVLSHD